MSPLLFSVILGAVSLSAVAQLTLKVGVERARFDQAVADGPVAILLAILQSPMIVGGLAMYGVGVIAWLWVLSKADLSVAYPFVGLSFLLTAAFGALLLNEQVTAMRLMGVVLIAVGCVLVARTA